MCLSAYTPIVNATCSFKVYKVVAERQGNIVSPIYILYKWKKGINKVNCALHIISGCSYVDEGLHFYTSFAAAAASRKKKAGLILLQAAIPRDASCCFGAQGEVVTTVCYVSGFAYKWNKGKWVPGTFGTRSKHNRLLAYDIFKNPTL